MMHLNRENPPSEFIRSSFPPPWVLRVEDLLHFAILSSHDERIVRKISPTARRSVLLSRVFICHLIVAFVI